MSYPNLHTFPLSKAGPQQCTPGINAASRGPASMNPSIPEAQPHLHKRTAPQLIPSFFSLTIRVAQLHV